MKHFLLLLLFPAICFGQGDQKIINVPIDNSGTTELAILHLPDDYSTATTTKYPILVFLHGIGEGGTNPATIYTNSNAGGPAYWIAQGKFPSSFVNPADKKSYKYIVVSPQSNQGWSTTAPQLDVVLTSLIKNYRVDESRIYLTGLSAGGEGVVEYVGQILSSGAMVTPTHKIAAVLPMSAVMNAGYEPQYAAKIVANNVQLWGFGSPTDTHGANTLGLIYYTNLLKTNYATETSYSGGHCCWGQFYDPNYQIKGKSIYEWALQYTQGVSAPPSTTPSAPVASPVAVPGKVEAEAYATMSGVATESTGDAGGGSDVGWIDQGDYMDYSVNVATAGQYSVGFRVATPNAGASFQFTKTDGTVLATVSVPNTGGYQTWQTVTATVTLAAGVQTLRIKSTASPIWNINWIQFTQSVVSNPGTSIPGTMQAEGYSAMSGIGTETTGDTGGGQDVGWLDNGDWMDYAVNVTTAGRYTASFRIATPNIGATFQVLTSSGVVLSTVTVPYTGGYQTWQNVSATLNLPAGSQTLRIKSVASAIWNINWWQVTANNTLPAAVSIPGTIQAESYSAMSGIGTETTGDTGGGLDVGWVDNGDYMDYAVNVTAAGVYTASFRTSAPAAGATLQVLNSSGTVLTTVKVPNTAAFTTWQTVTANITLPAGNQTLRIKSAALPHWNINWIQLAKAATGTAATVGTQSRTALQMGGDSTAEDMTSNLIVFPNPVHDQLTIRINNDQTGTMLVQLTDAYGAIRGAYNFSKTAGFTQVNLSTANLTSGVYFVRIQIGNRSEIRKIIKL